MITSLNHIGFEVPDLQEARQFFVEALGFRVLEPEAIRVEPDLAIWHELGGGSVSLLCLEHYSGLRIGIAEHEILQQSYPKQPVHWRYHLALNVGDLKALLNMLAEYPNVHIRSTSRNRKPESACIITPWGMYIQLIEKPSPDLLAQRA